MARTEQAQMWRDRALAAEAERDRLRAAIDAIPRHTPWADTGRCSECGSLGWPDAWPCPTEQAHIAATQSTASAEDRAATTGRVNASHLVGEGPHDATSNPCGGAAEGTLPAPGNPPHAPRVLP